MGSVTLQCIVVAFSKLPPDVFKGHRGFVSLFTRAGDAHPLLPAQTQPCCSLGGKTRLRDISTFKYDYTSRPPVKY